VGRRVVAVTGIFGAWLNQVSRCLESAGGVVLWPEQDLELGEARDKYRKNGENKELLRIHEFILEECNLGWFSPLRPKFFDVPYPGPHEYLSKFPEDKHVILTDINLCFFLPLWQDYLTDLVVVRVPYDEADKTLAEWLPRTTRQERREVIDNYQQSLEGDIGLISKVWYIENKELKVNPGSTCLTVGKPSNDLNSRIYAKEGI
jgi:hypothetical protein